MKGWLGILVIVVSAPVLAQAPPQVTFEGAAAPGPDPGEVQLTFVAALPNGYHVNSNAPLEEFLRPTRLLVTPPAGATLGEVRYPDALLFKTRFSEQPLSVYEHQFEIGAVLDIGGLAPGDYPIEAILKYQACSDRICYPPTTRTTQLQISILSDN